MLSNGRYRLGRRPRRSSRCGSLSPAPSPVPSWRSASLVCLGCREVLAYDMGGTTAKACLIRDGALPLTDELEVARSRRFTKSSGFPVAIPAVSMIEIGAGGGSIARINALGIVQVGPGQRRRRPRARPATASAATRPTVSDADLVLGYLDADHFAGGTMRLDRAAAARGNRCGDRWTARVATQRLPPGPSTTSSTKRWRRPFACTSASAAAIPPAWCSWHSAEPGLFTSAILRASSASAGYWFRCGRACYRRSGWCSRRRHTISPARERRRCTGLDFARSPRDVAEMQAEIAAKLRRWCERPAQVRGRARPRLHRAELSGAGERRCRDHREPARAAGAVGALRRRVSRASTATTTTTSRSSW